MEDDLKKMKWKSTSKNIKMEDDLQKMEDDLKNKIEDDLQKK